MNSYISWCLVIGVALVLGPSCGGRSAGSLDTGPDLDGELTAPADMTVEDLEADDLASPAWDDGVDATEKDTETVVASSCPTKHPWLTNPQTWECDLPAGTVCSWAAWDCTPGQKPDNVCTCVEQFNGKLRFDCKRPFHNCLPLEGMEEPTGMGVRPLPPHRETAEPCESTLVPRPDVVCSDNAAPWFDPPECTTDADCEGEGARCLPEWMMMGETLCTCHTPECFQDADCLGLAVCSCGKTTASPYFCGGPGESCLHECLPSDCRTDADCGESKFCSPSWDICGWQKVGYYCHDPEVAECLSVWDCMSEYQWQCNFVKGTGWTCQERPLCD